MGNPPEKGGFSFLKKSGKSFREIPVSGIPEQSRRDIPDG